MRPFKTVLVCAAVLGLLLPGCEKKPADDIDQEALDQIALTIEAELNAPGTAILTLLRTAGDASQVGGDSLVIGIDGKNLPIDWWLYRRGYVQLFGQLSLGRLAFGITQKARDEIAKGDAAWFTAEVGEPTRVDCATPDAVAVAGCEVELPVTPALSPAGLAALGAATLAPLNLVALVAPGDEGGWTVTDFRSEGPLPADVALNAIFGTENTRVGARMAALEEMNGRVSMTPEAMRRAEAEFRAAPPPIEDTAPIEPTAGGRPLGLDLPERPPR